MSHEAAVLSKQLSIYFYFLKNKNNVHTFFYRKDRFKIYPNAWPFDFWFKYDSAPNNTPAMSKYSDLARLTAMSEREDYNFLADGLNLLL